MREALLLACLVFLAAIGEGHALGGRKRIVGGSPAAVGDFPWQCELFNKAANSVFCGCSIISQRWVLTAAHCLRTIDESAGTQRDVDLNEIQIILGTIDLTSATRSVKPVTLARMHPSYSADVLRVSRVDLAWIRLQDPLFFDGVLVAPVELAGLSDVTYYPPASVGKQARVSGWGKRESPLPNPSVLHAVTIPIQENAACNQVLAQSNRAPTISNGAICAGSSGMDSCGGDSGSALTLTFTGSAPKQIGVVSYGTGPECGADGDFGVYVRVGPFKDYIQMHMDEPLLAGLSQGTGAIPGVTSAGSSLVGSIVGVIVGIALCL